MTDSRSVDNAIAFSPFSVLPCDRVCVSLLLASLQLLPKWRMVARVLLASYPGINASGAESLGKRFVEQQMIDPQAGVSLPMLTIEIPERENGLIGMQRSNRIDPALVKKASPARPALRLKESIFPPGARIVNVKICRHHVEVTRENDGMLTIHECRGMDNEPLKPAKLIVEFWPRLRISVGKVEAANNETADGRFKITAVVVGRITGKCAANRDDVQAARQDGDSIPGPLPFRDKLVASSCDGERWKSLVGGLEFLQTCDIRLFTFKPRKQVRESTFDAIDVVGRNLHVVRYIPAARSRLKCMAPPFMRVTCIMVSVEPSSVPRRITPPYRIDRGAKVAACFARVLVTVVEEPNERPNRVARRPPNERSGSLGGSGWHIGH